MRTKTTLLLAAAITAAGIASLQAQSNVYSLNVVGYYNVVIPGGTANNLRMVANQLKTSDTLLNTVIPSVPAGTIFLKWNGAGFTPSEYIDSVDKWDPATTFVDVGEGGFINNKSGAPITVTFVGEVPQGTLVNPILAGTSLEASMVPQAGRVTTDLGLPVIPSEVILTWLPTGSGGYKPHEYIGPADGFDPVEPSVAVGESFFTTKGGPAQNWTRTFTVQ